MQNSKEYWVLWSRRMFVFFSYLFLVGFASVMPIDSLAQASQSSNNALNTFIVVGALVIFAIVCIVLVVVRTLYYKSCLQEIPRKYVPITSADLPHHGSRELVVENMKNSKELANIFKKPKDAVIHPGVEPPVRCDKQDQEKLLPEYLDYGSCVKIIADRLKFKGVFMTNTNTNLRIDSTFSTLVKETFNDDDKTGIISEKSEQLIHIYEKLRYSGESITRDEFLEFMELCIFMVEHSLVKGKEEFDIFKIGSMVTENNEIAQNSTSLELQYRYADKVVVEDSAYNNFISNKLNKVKMRTDHININENQSNSIPKRNNMRNQSSTTTNTNITQKAYSSQHSQTSVSDSESFATIIHRH